jgi:eukaryotic-like serine/threonine-protein kinase
MSLQPGRLIGPYHVTALLGSGGMGEVWRAHDSKLGRDVALKTLPPGFSTNLDRVARLTREARLLASLSHPNIAAIHGLEESDGEHVLVMELVEGPTLAERMAKGRLPRDEALSIAQQIAEGLEAAHEKGIVHRDLKPANVVVPRKGTVKLLDFGIAKALSVEPGDVWEVPPDASTQPASSTSEGIVLGTTRYMSPEQAQGKPVDRRADVWAFGVVLFEMLSGGRLFDGETVSDVLASVLRQEIDWTRLPRDVPRSVRHLLGRCLERDPGERLRDIREARIALEGRIVAREAEAAARRGPRNRLSFRARLVLAAAVAAGAVGVGAVGIHALRPPGRGALEAARFDIEMPKETRLSTAHHELDISPDGKRIAFSALTWKGTNVEPGPRSLFLRDVDDWEAQPLPGGEEGGHPVFSPDGRWIAFVVSQEGIRHLKKTPAGGGTPTTLCSWKGAAPVGLTWAGDRSLVFGSRQGPLQLVPAPGGTPEAVTTLDGNEGEWSHRLPHVLPDGRTVIYTALRDSRTGPVWAKARIYAQELGSPTRTLLVEGGSDGRWAPPGVLLFAREGALFAARLSSSGLALSGSPVRVLPGVRHAVLSYLLGGGSGATQVAVSRDGRLVYAQGSVDPEHPRTLLWVDAGGRETVIDRPAQSYLSINLSPDGKQLLATHNYQGRQVQVIDLARGATRNVTFEGSHREAVWGPGRGEVTFDSDHEGPKRIYVRRLDAPPGEIETFWKGSEELVALGSWSPDGRRFCIQVRSPRGGDDILEVSRDGKVAPLVATRLDEGWPVISPDGRWLAYAQAGEPGRFEVFVQSLAAPGIALQASVSGGSEPLWSRDGKALFFKRFPSAGELLEVCQVRVSERNGSLELGRPEKLFGGVYGSTARGGRDWDVAADGRFLLDKAAADADQRIYDDAVFLTRLRVDLAGIPALFEEAEKQR